MKIEYEIIHPDQGSSFRLLHTNTDAEQYAWQYHYHPEFEITCVPRGSGSRHIGNHFSHYTDGNLVFLGPNLPHAGFGLNSHGPHEEIVIQVKEEVLMQSVANRPEMLAIQKLLEKTKHGIYFTGKTKELITKRLQKFLTLPAFERYMELISILQTMAMSKEMVLVNPETDLAQLISKNNIRLQHIFTYVEQHYQHEVNIKQVASAANLSVPAFCNYFKKIMGTTFTDFVNQYRIQRACMLLQQEKSVSETSFECGFNNVVYFNKVFKSIIKKTPSAFKKEKAILSYL